MPTLLARLRTFCQRYIPADVAPETYPLDKKHAIFFLAVAAVYLILEVHQHLVMRDAIWVADSVDYIFPASKITIGQLFSWPYAKPWGAALLYRLISSSPQRIDLFQTLISAAAWLFFAWIFSKSIQVRPLKRISWIAILGFSLTDQVQMWNHVILSESLSISLMILALGLWLSLLQRWNWPVLVVLAFVLIYWINTREINLYLSLLVAAGIFLFGLIRRDQRFYWLISCILVITSLITLRNSERLTPPRWAFSLTNVILQRILPRPEYTDFFVSQDMPVNVALMRLEGQWAYSNDFAVFNASDLNRFERWLYAKGKKTYSLFLLTHPKYTLLFPWVHWKDMMAEPGMIEIYELNYRPLFPKFIDNLFFPVQWFEIYAWLCLVLMMSVFFVKPQISTRAFWLVAVLLILWVPHILLVWHGDAMELARHAVQANIQFRLAMWMLLLLVGDAVMLRVAKRRGRQDVSPFVVDEDPSIIAILRENRYPERNTMDQFVY